MAKNRILIVDDEPAVRFGIRDFLELQGYEVDEAETCQDARHLFGNSRPDVVIADYMLPDGTALDLLPRLSLFVTGDTNIRLDRPTDPHTIEFSTSSAVWA